MNYRYTNFGSADFLAVRLPYARPDFSGISIEEVSMVCELIIAFVTCVATVISTIIAILRYKKR
ncbi:MAG: hypothetical protein J6R03_00905 [Treponema sp.]|nr:hypothetical protein [Treponema sp.]